MRVLGASLAIAVLAAIWPATAGERCDVPLADWKPREALREKLMAQGWEVRSIQTEDGCYDAYVVDRKGNEVEAYFNPKTLERVLTEALVQDQG
ncbi:MAG: PepSY domain-containing protein [Hyphomicrobiales bacterium]|nr:PepSY domain-containing protein [Hyphomicrobiales bacterium]